jgi:hypothetical protein
MSFNYNTGRFSRKRVYNRSLLVLFKTTNFRCYLKFIKLFLFITLIFLVYTFQESFYVNFYSNWTNGIDRHFIFNSRDHKNRVNGSFASKNRIIFKPKCSCRDTHIIALDRVSLNSLDFEYRISMIDATKVNLNRREQPSNETRNRSRSSKVKLLYKVDNEILESSVFTCNMHASLGV